VVALKETLTHHPNSNFVEEILKDQLRDTLKESKARTSNEKGLKRTTLQCDEVLECLKAIDGHPTNNILKRHQSFLHGSLVFSPLTPSSNSIELYLLCLTLMLH
jgi:hypothetical protein